MYGLEFVQSAREDYAELGSKFDVIRFLIDLEKGYFPIVEMVIPDWDNYTTREYVLAMSQLGGINPERMLDTLEEDIAAFDEQMVECIMRTHLSFRKNKRDKKRNKRTNPYKY